MLSLIKEAGRAKVTVATLENIDSTSFSLRTVPCRYAAQCRGACQHFGDKMLDPAIFTDMECVRRERRRSMLIFLIIAMLLTTFGFLAVYAWAERRGRAELTTFGDDQLHFAITRLEREIGKYGILPLTLAMDRDVGAFMVASNRAGRLDAMGNYLARFNAAAGTMQAYLIGPDGVVIASSNWKDPTSFVSRNISYRPYFQDAKAGTVTGYYGIGTTGNKPGYYLATAVESGGRRVGVVAIKIDLEQLENDWLSGTDQLMLMTDSNRVVVLSSRKEWKYHSLGTLAPQKLEELNQTQQYNRHVMDALSWQSSSPDAESGVFVTVEDTAGAHTYLANTRFVPAVAMDLTVLADYASVKSRATERATIAAILILLAVLCVRIANQRRLAMQERLLAREALQEAYNHLKRQFEDRNRQLRVTNEDLRHEVAERIEAAKRLQNFQDELIHTENLAVIGQLSAGLAHEINQPLAALSTLSENAVRFLELNDTGTVRHNLERICDLARRMGVLTGQLRSFARRTDGETGPVDVERSIESAVALLSHRIKKEHVQIVVERPVHLIEAYGDAVRLEQVLVNLISNAMDALHGNGEPRIDIHARIEDEWAVIEVADNGHGLSGPVMEKLFEPFFTTKKTSGLGLGLAISQDIIRRFGGDLTAANGDNGGAFFRVTLRAVKAEEKVNA